MKKKKVLKGLLTILLIILNIISIIMVGYSLILYKSVETFYRIMGILIMIYLFILFSYLLLRSIKKRKSISFIIPCIFMIIFILVEVVSSYYLSKIYKSIDQYSDNKRTAYSSLVSYKLKDVSELNNKIIGIINNTNEVEGNTLPLKIINDKKLNNSNTIKEYNSTIELLYALKNNQIDAAFFSSNYVDMFSSLDGYEDIDEETNILLSDKMTYTVEDEDTSSKLDEAFTMLLIGVDSSKDGVTSGYNADVLLLVTFNPDTLRATITSIPRDMYLKTACSGNTYRRINTTTWGSSSECAVKTVENLFNIDINYYAKINFKGVVSLVDSVGGINVDVPYSLCDQNSSRKWGDKTIYVEKGNQHLNGEQALALARNRHKPGDGSSVGNKMNKYCPTYTEGNRSDYTRGKNQMKVILGVAKSAAKLKDPNQAIEILSSINNNFQTNISSDEVLSFYNLGKEIFLKNIDLLSIERMQLNGYNGWGKIYEKDSNSYPAVTIPYQGSIDDISNEMNINLGKIKPTLIKTISFDLNKLYEEKLIGNQTYKENEKPTIKNFINYSVSEIKAFATSNNSSVKFIDINTNQEVDIYDYSNYYFHSQKEHVDMLLDQVDYITIYVKKR